MCQLGLGGGPTETAAALLKFDLSFDPFETTLVQGFPRGGANACHQATGDIMTLNIVSWSRCFDGTQYTYQHRSSETGTMMRFAAFVPPQAHQSPVPVVWYLSGLTCTEENFTTKAGAQRIAAELGLLLIAPDTSPRGDGVPGDPAGSYDFGLGAGFYVDATQHPWSRNYRMASYVERELPGLIGSELPADVARQSIMGHSMGGHGALTIALRNQGRFASVSAFSPICSPMNCPWGQKAFSGYLGSNKESWRRYDACALLEDGERLTELLVDQGTEDQFRETQLKPALLEDRCARAGIPLTLRMHEGYDHSYFFISTFIEDHLRWHARRLGTSSA
jgi:S-formylglutathione hydrolase